MVLCVLLKMMIMIFFNDYNHESNCNNDMCWGRLEQQHTTAPFTPPPPFIDTWAAATGAAEAPVLLSAMVMVMVMVMVMRMMASATAAAVEGGVPFTTDCSGGVVEG